MLPLVRAYFPAWWARKASDAELAAWAKQLRQDWDASQLFGELETAPLLVRRLQQLAADVGDWAGLDERLPRAPDAERGALLQIIAICLARLVAGERVP